MVSWSWTSGPPTERSGATLALDLIQSRVSIGAIGRRPGDSRWNKQNGCPKLRENHGRLQSGTGPDIFVFALPLIHLSGPV